MSKPENCLQPSFSYYPHHKITTPTVLTEVPSLP